LSNSSSIRNRFFVTGSDTDVGKTWVSCLLLAAAQRFFSHLGAYKPVASGVSRLEESDAFQLWSAIGKRSSVEQVCPQSFVAPLAPSMAAELEGRSVSIPQILDGYRYWEENSDFLLVEGAGGLYSPITFDYLNADLAKDLALPLVVVVANRVGVINQTLLTLEAARVMNLSVAVIILNQMTLEEFAPKDSRHPEYLQSAMEKLKLPPAPIVEVAYQQIEIDEKAFKKLLQ
jgi:dethiobiotin synthetase